VWTATGGGSGSGAPYLSTLIAGPDSTKTITGATHGFTTTALLVVVYDNATPRRSVLVGWTVNSSTFDVVITFASPQSNYYVVINGGVGPQGAAGATGSTGAAGSNGTNGTNGTNGLGYAPATSTTSLAIATGSTTFTTQSGLALNTASRVRTASHAGNTNYMEGAVTSYSGTTLVVLVDAVGGSGTKNDWDISIVGQPGANGVGSGTVTSITLAGTSNQITVTGTCTVTSTGTCTFSLPSGLQIPGTINKLTLTQPATGATVTIVDAKTFTVNKTLTLDGTDGVTITFPASSATVATLGLTNTFTGRQDASGAASTAPMKVGTSLPGTCAVGDQFFKSDATAGQNLYFCTATNTWTQQLNSGGGATGFKVETAVTTAVGPINTTTAETNLITYTLPANELGPGQFIVFRGSGTVGWTTGTPTVTLRSYLGGGAANTGSQTSFPAVANSSDWTYEFTCQTAAALGASASVSCRGKLIMNSSFGLSTQAAVVDFITSPVTLATNGTLAFKFTAQWSASSASNTITQTDLLVRKYN
jgi:hypothetical protein